MKTQTDERLAVYPLGISSRGSPSKSDQLFHIQCMSICSLTAKVRSVGIGFEKMVLEVGHHAHEGGQANLMGRHPFPLEGLEHPQKGGIQFVLSLGIPLQTAEPGLRVVLFLKVEVLKYTLLTHAHDGHNGNR